MEINKCLRKRPQNNGPSLDSHTNGKSAYATVRSDRPRGKISYYADAVKRLFLKLNSVTTPPESTAARTLRRLRGRSIS